MSDSSKDTRTIGRDEMNLAEFPITAIAERAPKGCKTLIYEGHHGRLIITGSDAYGLPTAPDADVIVGLIQLTKLRNNFTDPTVAFTLYELCGLLGWGNDGRYYRRLDESLNRWVGVTLYYEQAWWDNSIKCHIDAKFHILDSVAILNQKVRRKLRARQQPLPLSSFTWGKVFFKSCQNENLKRLDLDSYFSLKSAVSRQMYRFLDKRFYVRGEWTFDLRKFAFEHVGLSRNYTAAKIKEKLQPAFEELEGIGLLEPMANAERYAKVDRGEWKIRLVRTVVEVKSAELEPPSLERELIERGVTASTARELVREYPEERIQAQIAAMDWTRQKTPKKIADPGAYLVDAIRHDYAPPAGFTAAAQRAEAAAAERTQEAAAQQAKARQREEQARVDAYWHGLTPEQQARLEAEALEQADPAERASCETGSAALRRMARSILREAHIRRALGLPPVG